MSEKKKKKVTETQLKMVFAHVLRGYSEFKSTRLGNETIYIKHLNIFDNVETDTIYENNLSTAKKKKLPTEKQQKVYLEKEKLWTGKQEIELNNLRIFLSNLHDTKSKFFLKSQIDEIKKEIEESEEKIRELEDERENLIGFTAERYACLLYTSPSPRDATLSRMPSSA